MKTNVIHIVNSLQNSLEGILADTVVSNENLNNLLWNIPDEWEEYKDLEDLFGDGLNNKLDKLCRSGSRNLLEKVNIITTSYYTQVK